MTKQVETKQEQRLQAFFVRYGEALAAGDLPTIADCYAVPALVLSDEGSIPVAVREEVEAAFGGASERYRARRLVNSRPTIIGSEAITERLVFANVRWDYLDEQGGSAQQSRAAALRKKVTATCSAWMEKRGHRSKSS